MTQQFDYVIVGAGTAGCVLANKLSADKQVSVLLLESGPEDTHPMIHIPKGFSKILGSKTNIYNYQAEPGPTGKTTSESWVRGHTLGGSSSVNGLIYLRGHEADYEHWEHDLGLTGWGWRDFKRIFMALEDHELGANEWRAVGGPVHVSQSTNRTFLMDQVIEAAAEMGLPKREDPSHPDQDGFSYMCSNIYKGRRWSAARAFLDPVRQRKNLTVWTSARAKKLVFNGNKATSVEVLRNGKPVTVSARREIIVCAGGLESPLLLQRSGIGDGAHLKELGIPLVKHAPAVGQNMREHLIYTMQFRLKGPYSQNKEYSGWRLWKHMAQYVLTKTGLLANGPYDVTGFIRTNPSEQRPDATIVAGPFTMDLAKWVGFEKGVPMEDEPGCSILGYVQRPESKGYIKLRSPDEGAAPLIVHNHLTHETDCKAAIGVARFIRQLVRQPALAPYVGSEVLPGARYETDEEILETYSMMGGSGYHAAGTCQMGREEDNVVDERLRVRGIENLRVVDLSIFPTLISGATNIPVMAMAWRAAELITQDYQKPA